MPIDRDDSVAGRIGIPAPSISRRAFLTFTAAVAVSGCRSRTNPEPDVLTWGAHGTRDGDFVRPRAVGVHLDRVYVADVTGRIQVFTRDGEFIHLWSMPEHENGTPTCVAFAADGRVLVPDTHYSRIAEFTLDGRLLEMWGSYGSEPGQFIYPTGIVESPHGQFYVCEYGEGAERVQVFSRNRKFSLAWGAHGTEPGNFNRAMGIAMGPDHIVCVADTANHRIQCFDPQGRLVRAIGRAGTGRGKLKFPQGIALAPDESIVVCEYGANRVSRFSKQGEFLGSFGAAGRGPGEFGSPRAVAVSDTGDVFVADTENHRVQRFSLEAIA